MMQDASKGALLTLAFIFFPESLGQFSDQQGEELHQELLQNSIRYIGKN